MDELTACEQAYQRGYEAGLKAQYGEVVGSTYREIEYRKKKISYLESEIRFLKNQLQGERGECNV